jgi:hypothetical protein
VDTLGQRSFPFLFRHDRVMTAEDERFCSPPRPPKAVCLQLKG